MAEGVFRGFSTAKLPHVPPPGGQCLANLEFFGSGVWALLAQLFACLFISMWASGLLLSTSGCSPILLSLPAHVLPPLSIGNPSGRLLCSLDALQAHSVHVLSGSRFSKEPCRGICLARSIMLETKVWGSVRSLLLAVGGAGGASFLSALS